MKENADTHNNLDKSQNHYAEREEPNTKEYDCKIQLTGDSRKKQMNLLVTKNNSMVAWGLGIGWEVEGF